MQSAFKTYCCKGDLSIEGQSQFFLDLVINCSTLHFSTKIIAKILQNKYTANAELVQL